MNTYEINDRNEVVPYTSGRRCTDTMAWRDATELELQQQDEIKTLETELAAVTEQRDEALSDLEFRRDLFVLQEQQLNDVRAERDRLAEALREVATYDPSDGQCNSGYSCKYIAEQALQSLNPDHTVDANDMIAVVKGGSDEP